MSKANITRQGYELIAHQIAIYTNNDEVAERQGRQVIRTGEQIAWDFAGKLELQNPKFNRAKFLELCGVENE